MPFGIYHEKCSSEMASIAISWALIPCYINYKYHATNVEEVRSKIPDAIGISFPYDEAQTQMVRSYLKRH